MSTVCVGSIKQSNSAAESALLHRSVASKTVKYVAQDFVVMFDKVKGFCISVDYKLHAIGKPVLNLEQVIWR